MSVVKYIRQVSKISAAIKRQRMLGISSNQLKKESLDMDAKIGKIMFVGLGNHDMPRTRHSVGMALVDRLAHFLDIKWAKNRDCLAFLSHKQVGSVDVILVKPRVPMNINGRSIAKAAQLYGVDPSAIYLVHDDLDKPIGKFSMKQGGSARGHNGVKSVISSLKSDVMPRLVIGIGRPAERSQVVDYVLEPFTAGERKEISVTLNHALVKLKAHVQTRIDMDLTCIGHTCAWTGNDGTTSQSGKSPQETNDR